jgi:hypothetical protein
MRDDFLQEDKKAKIEEFNQQLKESLDNTNFMVKNEGEFKSMYLDDIDDDSNPGVIHGDEAHTPSVEDYGDIAENMFVQVNNEGNQFWLLQEIMDHKIDHSAIPILDSMVHSANGTLKPKQMTRGWFLFVQWHDGSVSWEKLADLKVSNPVEVAEYAVVNQLVEAHTFKWWVPHIIHQRNRIISKVKS